MNLPAIRTTEPPTILPPATPVTAASNLVHAPPLAVSLYRFANPSGNLSEAAKPVFEALQSAAAFPPSATPTYVLPTDGSDFLRLFTAVQAIAAERIYPAPVFSFQA
jgi:hypothetical protein